MIYEWITNMDFAFPLAFGLLVLLPVLIFWYIKKNNQQQTSIVVTTIHAFTVKSWKNRFRHLRAGGILVVGDTDPAPLQAGTVVGNRLTGQCLCSERQQTAGQNAQFDFHIKPPLDNHSTGSVPASDAVRPLRRDRKGESPGNASTALQLTRVHAIR